MRKLVFAFFLGAVLWSAVAVAAPDFVPVPDLSKYLTSDNLAKLADGDIVKENIMEKDAAGNDKGRGVALIMIDAPPDKVMAALDSFETYPSWMPNTKQTKVVKREGNRVDVEFELSIVGSQVTYTCIHEVNKDAGTVRWRMDDAKPKKNVADSVGAWVVKAHGDGKSIVAYTVAVDTGMSVPKFIQNWLTNTSLKKVVKSVRDKVEGK